jgi:hypothetical protein
MTARPYRMRRSGRPSPGRRALAVMLLMLLAAVVLLPVADNHHGTVAHTHHHHVTLTMDAPHHHTGEPVPAHGHQHESGLEANATPRARLAVPDATVAIAAVVERVTDSPVSPEAAPDAALNVDLTLLGVLRV